jgi:glycerol-3-phosphate acyltransferase PlsY
MIPALLVVAGYVMGSMPWGLWLVRMFRGEDIRTQGSGNIGATNVWRVHGRRLGLAAVVLDTL